jgi:segregation and condensation protein B
MAEARATPETEEKTPPPLHRILEAFLFVGDGPLSAERAALAVRGLDHATYLTAIEQLSREYREQGRPFRIEADDKGHRLALRPPFQGLRQKLHGDARVARLAPAALDVLALVAYRQPASKSEVDALRGADSGALLRQLVRRGLIAVVQRGDAVGREVAYGTTARFLELFQLRSLDDLPRTQDLQQI